MSRLLPLRRIPLRPFIQTRPASSTSSFRPQPGPPKLPAEEQAEFERLQRKASVSQAFQPESSESTSTSSSTSSSTSASSESTADKAAAAVEEDDMNPGYFRGAKPEFEGDTNPKTGEVGGPKNEPLRWGGGGDWSYNGRVTDF